MSTDTMRNPSVTTTVLRWYKPTETTPFALCGHIGPVLVQVNPEKFGCRVREVWFGDDGWAEMDGAPFDDADILAFAIADPDDRATEDDEPASAAELHKALAELAAAMREDQQRIGYVKGSPKDRMVWAAEKLIAKGT